MENKAQPGDLVEVHFGKIIYEGTLLESPESDKGIILLKLGNGYNIGFNKKEILKIEVLKKFTEKENKFELKNDSTKPNIGMIITGGTIASRYDSKTGGVHPLDSPESLFKFYPGIFEKVNILKVEVPFMKWSESMDYKDWEKIARVAEKLLNDNNIQGIVITHGTDFLHYTSSALSLMLGKLNKPVVLTYSQRSIDRASSDATLNLQCAVEIAGLSDIAEVVLVGHANSEDNFCHVMRGTKVRKMHTSRRDAFKVINGSPIAKVYSNKIEILENFNKRNSKVKVNKDISFQEKVALIKFYPGQNPNILDYYIKEGYRGIIIEMAGIGQIATKGSRNPWTSKLKEAIGKGMIICACSQCINGRVDPLVYSAGREILETGVIYLEDMISETAFVKLGWVMGHKEWIKSREKIKEKMLENISGEFNKRLKE
jgi:glutamyl-tRNA(Gln) amidotransferase subunit D